MTHTIEHSEPPKWVGRAWEAVPYTRQFHTRSEGGKYREVPERAWKSEYALACEQRRLEYEHKSAADFRQYADTGFLYQLAKGGWPEDCASRAGRMLVFP
jgi:hypothetical protein